jgi:hypothetical protein
MGNEELLVAAGRPEGSEGDDGVIGGVTVIFEGAGEHVRLLSRTKPLAHTPQVVAERGH